MGSFVDLLTRLDRRPAVRGRQFERLCAWYLRNAPEYRPKFRRVWLWSEWPGAWAPDAGIDLVAEEHDGGLWAIQAKAYHPDYAIKKADVDSFLASNRTCARLRNRGGPALSISVPLRCLEALLSEPSKSQPF